MPLYEFRCRDCDHGWETRMEWKAPLPDCPDCGSENVRKVFHAAALVFKGSGWHVNDYKSSSRNGGSKPATSSEGGESSSSSSDSSSSSTSSESKDTGSSTAKADSTTSAPSK